MNVTLYIPAPLNEWLTREAKRRGYSRSRLVQTLIVAEQITYQAEDTPAKSPSWLSKKQAGP